jgi:NADH-ubiquinone oxidoreductase chain 6
MGSVMLTMFSLDYFALLFLLVYVGAIVVLFLFIVMMLELKMINISERFRDLFNVRNLIIPSLLVEIFLLEQADVFNGLSTWYQIFYNSNIIEGEIITVSFGETNLYIDYSKLLTEQDPLTTLGTMLFKEEKLGILLAALLLFISMIGSIVLTMDSKAIHVLKSQDGNHQMLRNSGLASNSYRI